MREQARKATAAILIAADDAGTHPAVMASVCAEVAWLAGYRAGKRKGKAEALKQGGL